MWIPQENEDKRRTQDCQPQTPHRTQKAHDRLKFPKSARIVNRSHFKNLLKNGSRLLGEWLSVDFRKGRSPCPRLGLTVSRRHGKSHDRNRFKRLVRESFRELYPTLPCNLEINVFPRKPSTKVDKTIILNDLSQIVNKIRSI